MVASGTNNYPANGSQRDDIAIIGMSCMFPGAPDLRTFWQNIIDKFDAIGEPPESWGPSELYAPDSVSNDRIYCRRGGYLESLSRFDPLKYGVMPRSVDGAEPEHFLALRVASEAVDDAGYSSRQFNRDRTAVILGRSNFLNRGNVTAAQHGLVIDQTLSVLRELAPQYSEADLGRIREGLKAKLPPFNAETASGLVSNVMCGRIANALGLRGPNYTVDAACASSLVAVDLGFRELLSRRCDMALVGGVSVSMPPIVFMVFCQLGALSRSGRIRPFDKEADGTLLGAGLGVVVLKRRQDAERDNDRIYAILKSVGCSSDGHGASVLAPQTDGEELALRRAYEDAEIDPATVGLIEAHGTGTRVGDLTEVQSLRRVFGDRLAKHPDCAMGTVKSMIGHTIPASGIAGLIKTSLSLYHRVLPPTLHCDQPNRQFELEKTRFFINTEPRPWIHGAATPRRAGVNAFGFGGVNTHAILEEHTGMERGTRLLRRWDTEVIVAGGANRREVIEAGELLMAELDKSDTPELSDVAYRANRNIGQLELRLAIVAGTVADLKKKLGYALKLLADPKVRRIKDRSGIFFVDRRRSEQVPLAFLFPGEGSQYVNMLSDLCLHFPEVCACFDEADRVFIENGRESVPSRALFPIAPKEDNEATLWSMDLAVASVFAANRGILSILDLVKIRADATAGHSSGEFAALLAAGALQMGNDGDLLAHMSALTNSYDDLERQVPEATLMTAGGVDPEILARAIDDSRGDVSVTMDNCAHQVVLCGSADGIARTRAQLEALGAQCSILPYHRGYHTSSFQAACDQLAQFYARLRFTAPRIPVYSCATSATFPSDPAASRQLALEQWTKPVLFRQTIEAMYEAGIRVFLEVGPRGNLTSFVTDILRGVDHVAIAANVPHRSGITQLNYAIGLLAAEGVSMTLDPLYERRGCRPPDAGETSHRETQAAPPLALNLPRISIDAPGIPQLQRTVNYDRSTAAAVTSKSVGAETPVMRQHLALMTQFASAQDVVLRSYAAKTAAPSLASPASSPEAARAPLAFPMTVCSMSAGQEATLECTFDPQEHLFLRDHTIGGEVSTTDNSLIGLPVVALSVRVELMAEAAARLVPGEKLIGMKDVSAYRWLVVEEEPCTVRLIATRQGNTMPHQILVRMVNCEGSAVAQGIMLFGSAFPAVDPIDFKPLQHQRTYPFPATSFYRREVMYHGPAFQSVRSIDRFGDNGLEASVTGAGKSHFFRSGQHGRMLTDPVLIDAAGQVVGFWAAGLLETGFVVFPVGFETFTIYREWPGGGEHLHCSARSTLLSDGRITSTIEFRDAGGELVARANEWYDKRFDFPRDFVRFVLCPRETFLSSEVLLPIDKRRVHCRVLACLPATAFEGALWPSATGNLILSRNERQTFSKMPGDRKRDWLTARLVAKDTVRKLIAERLGQETCPADIEIIGEPQEICSAAGALMSRFGLRVLISIAYCDDHAVALACMHGDARVGVDLQSLRNTNQCVAEVPLSADEEFVIERMTTTDKLEWRVRLACAKRALGKAVAMSPSDLVVDGIDAQTYSVSIRPRLDRSAKQPTGRDGTYTVHTQRENELIVASAVIAIEPGGN
jgi:acyl transferase domain-containing protein